MPRNLIFLIDGLSMGGAERLMIHILRHLSREHFQPRVCVLQQKDGNPVAGDIRALGIPVDWLPVHHLRDLTAIPRLYRYLRKVRADIVHTQLEFANVLGNVAASLAGVPSVCTIHVLPSMEAALKGNMHHRLEGLALRFFCDRVIAVSEQARLLHLAATGASPSQVVTVYNGIDLTGFSRIDRAAERRAVRRELGIPETAKVITTVAVLRPEKGIQYMIRALPAVLKAHPDACYLVVGGGAHSAELHAEAGRVDLDGRVLFTGMRSDIPRILAASDVFVLPTMTEALPTVLEEAMASRLPIVACAVGGVPEMVTDGVNGRLVSPTDIAALAGACNDLLADPDTRAKMAENGWQIVNQKFNIERQVDRLKEIYLDEIGRHGKYDPLDRR